MKNPSTARGAGAFRVTSTATLASPVDATLGSVLASLHDVRFYWDRDSNSCERLAFFPGRRWYE